MAQEFMRLWCRRKRLISTSLFWCWLYFFQRNYAVYTHASGKRRSARDVACSKLGIRHSDPMSRQGRGWSSAALRSQGRRTCRCLLFWIVFWLPKSLLLIFFTLVQVIENTVTLAPQNARLFCTGDTVKLLWAIVNGSKAQSLRHTAAYALARIVLTEKSTVSVRWSQQFCACVFACFVCLFLPNAPIIHIYLYMWQTLVDLAGHASLTAFIVDSNMHVRHAFIDILALVLVVAR